MALTLLEAFIFLSVSTPITRSVMLFWRGTATAHAAGAKLVLFRHAKRRPDALTRES